jgi:hypothetical protein
MQGLSFNSRAIHTGFAAGKVVRSRIIYKADAFLKTTVRNNVFVLDFIVHYLLHVSALIGGHLQVICTQNIY